MSINNRGSRSLSCLNSGPVLSVRLPKDLLKQLDKYCEEEDRPRTPAIRRFIRIALEKHNEVQHETMH